MLKGVVGRGWVQCLGRWSWLGPVFGSLVVVGLWLKWVVGRGSAKLHTASHSSFIVDWRAGFGLVGWDRLMVGLKRWIC